MGGDSDRNKNKFSREHRSWRTGELSKNYVYLFFYRYRGYRAKGGEENGAQITPTVAERDFQFLFSIFPAFSVCQHHPRKASSPSILFRAASALRTGVVFTRNPRHTACFLLPVFASDVPVFAYDVPVFAFFAFSLSVFLA